MLGSWWLTVTPVYRLLKWKQPMMATANDKGMLLTISSVISGAMFVVGMYSSFLLLNYYHLLWIVVIDTSFNSYSKLLCLFTIVKKSYWNELYHTTRKEVNVILHVNNFSPSSTPKGTARWETQVRIPQNMDRSTPSWGKYLKFLDPLDSTYSWNIPLESSLFLRIRFEHSRIFEVLETHTHEYPVRLEHSLRMLAFLQSNTFAFNT